LVPLTLTLETLQEQQIHLVLPQLEIFKDVGLFDDFWLKILILKGLQNENVKTRFKILEFVLTFKVATRIIQSDPSFLISVLEATTRQIYYQDLLRGSFKSDFGELVAGYISSLSEVLTESSYRNVMQMVAKFLPKIQSRIPSIFIIQGDFYTFNNRIHRLELENTCQSLWKIRSIRNYVTAIFKTRKIYI
jgi:hypothetical protein